MTRYAISLLGLAIMCLVFIPAFFKFKYAGRKSASLAVKGASTLIPCLMAFFAAYHHSDTVQWLVFIALLLCFFADVLIGIRFEVGMLIFALAHFAFMAVYLLMAPITWVAFAVYLFLIAAAIILFKAWWHRFENKMRIPFAGYALVLLFMTSLAIDRAIVIHDARSILNALGAVTFAISDGLLLRNLVGKITRKSDTVSLYVYYIALFLIAFAWFAC